MTCNSRPTDRLLRWPAASSLLALGAVALLGLAPPVAGQDPGMPPAAEEAELPHPFFTHMGLPEGVGVFNLRLAGLATRADGKTEGDFAFHFETGLTRSIGLHVRNDRFLDLPRSEVMFQFAAFTSADGMSGFAPIIEFEIPTRSGSGSRINSLVGFTSTLANARLVFNQALHYDPREDGVDASAALVVGMWKRVFPVIEVLGEGARGERPIVNLLGGLKVQVREGIVFGIAYQFPVSSREDFSSQLVALPEFEWKRAR
jgi:hypothetical protein